MMALGMLPLENELGSRALSSFAWNVQRRHGPLPLAEIFEERVASRFYEWTGGPDVPLSFSPPATLAIAAHRGAEVELAHRPSVRVPS